MAEKSRIRTFFQAVIIATVYAILLRVTFGSEKWHDLYSVMSVTFLFCLPLVMGVLTIYRSDVDKVRRLRYRLFAPWISILAFFALTLIFAWEGWACWIMVLPLFLIVASIGGLIAGYFKLRKTRDKVYVSLLVFLPFIISPVEHMVKAIPGTYEAYTYIDIHATPQNIWRNITMVKTIPAEQDKGWLTRFLGFPRPVKAELNYQGLGASREAIFTNGLVFHEKVTEYIDQKKMTFTIKAYPHEIPSTTMDEHVVIGGKYFDVLNGTYELERKDTHTYRLHLYSRFKLSTTFNFYASWWAKWIMKDIQNNILQVEKRRAEGTDET